MKVKLFYFIFSYFILIGKTWAGFCIGFCIGLGGDIPNGFIYSNNSTSNSMTINYDSSNREKEPEYSPFNPMIGPKRIVFYDINNKLLGGGTQIDQVGKIFVTSRHVLASKSFVKIKSHTLGKEKSKFLDIDNFYLIQIQNSEHNNSWLDIIFLVSKEGLSEVPKAQDLIEELTLRSTPPNSQLKWYSWNYGTFNSKTTDGFSSGLLLEKEISDHSTYFWLDAGTSNYTSPGSSGSVVWQTSDSNINTFFPIGVVQCMETSASREKSASMQLPKPRFIGLQFLVEANYDWSLVSSSELLFGPSQPAEENCIPIDGRQGGGL